MAHSIRSFVIGTGGHIDHGKTALVEQMTDANPDRLPEEQERDLTIDLGFAEYVMDDGTEVGLIDVPGHERFIRNMVAGATAMDFVLLVVAADDGVMPQTREHLMIMDTLGIERGIPVITKTDLVDEVLVEVVEEELRELLTGTFMDGAPVCRVSSETGDGYDAFLEVFESYVRETPGHPGEGPFRMPVQRVFTVKGFGTVVTGVPVSGQIEEGEDVEVQPGDDTGRVRGIQAHNQEISRASAGHRTALNIAEVHHEDVGRGDVVCEPGILRLRSIIGASFYFASDEKEKLEHWDPIRLLVGSAEVTGRIIPLEDPVIPAGDRMLIQLELDEPIAAVPGDPFVLRLQSPMVTLGGGVVIDLTDRRRTRSDTTYVRQLKERRERLDDWRDMARYRAEHAGTDPFRPADLATACYVPVSDVRDWLDTTNIRKELGWVRLVSTDDQFLSEEGMHEAADRVLDTLDHFHDEHPYLLGLEKHDLQNRTGLDPDVIPAVIDRLQAENKIDVTDGHVALSEHDAALPESLAEIRDRIIEVLTEKPHHTPSPEDLRDHVDCSMEALDTLLRRLEQNGEIVELEENIYFHRSAIEEARQLVVSQVEENGHLETGTFRDLLDTSRKYAIPLLEYFDDVGLTYRKDNRRYLQSSSEDSDR